MNNQSKMYNSSQSTPIFFGPQTYLQKVPPFMYCLFVRVINISCFGFHRHVLELIKNNANGQAAQAEKKGKGKPSLRRVWGALEPTSGPRSVWPTFGPRLVYVQSTLWKFPSHLGANFVDFG